MPIVPLVLISGCVVYYWVCVCVFKMEDTVMVAGGMMTNMDESRALCASAITQVLICGIVNTERSIPCLDV